MTSEAPAPTRLSISAILALAGGAVLLALHMTVRLFGAFSWDIEGGGFDPGILFGVLGLLSFVPIVGVIVAGHLGFLATRPGRKRGRTLATIGLTLGYVLFVLYFNRLIVVLLVATQSGDWGSLVTNFFWWA
jgi:hypothetical protein